jgi:hypothetical protein
MRLLDDDNIDKEFIDAITHASQWGITCFLRRLFVILLISNYLSRSKVVWNSTLQCLSDDVLHRQRRILCASGNYYFTVKQIVIILVYYVSGIIIFVNITNCQRLDVE